MPGLMISKEKGTHHLLSTEFQNSLLPPQQESQKHTAAGMGQRLPGNQTPCSLALPLRDVFKLLLLR